MRGIWRTLFLSIIFGLLVAPAVWASGYECVEEGNGISARLICTITDDCGNVIGMCVYWNGAGSSPGGPNQWDYEDCESYLAPECTPGVPPGGVSSPPGTGDGDNGGGGESTPWPAPPLPTSPPAPIPQTPGLPPEVAQPLGPPVGASPVPSNDQCALSGGAEAGNEAPFGVEYGTHMFPELGVEQGSRFAPEAGLEPDVNYAFLVGGMGPRTMTEVVNLPMARLVITRVARGAAAGEDVSQTIFLGTGQTFRLSGGALTYIPRGATTQRGIIGSVEAIGEEAGKLFRDIVNRCMNAGSNIGRFEQ